MRRRVGGSGWARLAVGMVLVGLLLAPGTALGQSLKEELIGAWRLVSNVSEQGGVKTHTFSEKPVGLTIYDRSGYVAQLLFKPGLPKFAVPNRLKGTDQEYREIMQGMVAGFGTYAVEGDTVTIKWESSSYPNRAGTTEKRILKITGDEMSGVNPTGATGGTSHTKYLRAK